MDAATVEHKIEALAKAQIECKRLRIQQAKRARRFNTILFFALGLSIGLNWWQWREIPKKVEEALGPAVQKEFDTRVGPDVKKNVELVDEAAERLKSGPLKNVLALSKRIEVLDDGAMVFNVAEDPKLPNGHTLIFDFGNKDNAKHAQFEEGGNVVVYEGHRGSPREIKAFMYSTGR